MTKSNVSSSVVDGLANINTNNFVYSSGLYSILNISNYATINVIKKKYKILLTKLNQKLINLQTGYYHILLNQ